MCACNPSIRTLFCPECRPTAIADKIATSVPTAEIQAAFAAQSIPDWQLRVSEEKAVLDEKLTKLSAFFGSLQYAQLEDEDRDLLIQQRLLMNAYSNTLAMRIKRFRSS